MEVKEKIINILNERFEPLRIEVWEQNKKDVFTLVEDGSLEGWCWESTQICALFMQDDDYIERGYIKLNELDSTPSYFHSWICFKVDGKEYVFDPALSKIASKENYYKHSSPIVMGRVSAKQVKEHFLKKMKEPKNIKRQLSKFGQFLREKIGAEAFDREIERQNRETLLVGNENINGPIYRGYVGYIAETKKDKIKNMTAHIYIS